MTAGTPGDPPLNVPFWAQNIGVSPAMRTPGWPLLMPVQFMFQVRFEFSDIPAGLGSVAYFGSVGVLVIADMP
jgi:hypothetical protein